MSRKVKRIVSIMLTAAFLIVMLSSCKALSVVNPDPIVLKIGKLTYTRNDYAEIFNDLLYTYVYSGGEAETNPDYANQSSMERLKVFQDYVYDKLIERGIKDYVIEKEKLEEKLTDDDNAEIDKLVEEVIESESSAKESDVSESDTTIEDMKTVTKDAGKEPTQEEIDALPETTEKEIETKVSEKLAVTPDDDTTDSDDATESADVTNSEDVTDSEDVSKPEATKSDDTTESDDATESDGEKKYYTREEAEAAVAKEEGFETFEEYKKSVEEKAEFDLWFGYYKKIKAREIYESKYADEHNGETFEDHVKSIREEKTTQYLRDTKVKDFLVGDYKASDEEAQKYFDELKKKYEDMEAADYYSYLNTELSKEHDEDDNEIVFVKGGYYYVKHVLIKFAEDTTASDDTTSSDAEKQVNPETKKAVEDQIAEINAMEKESQKLKAFDALIEKYGEDDGMKAEPAKTQGYLMGEGNSMVESFAKASDELYKAGKIGAISEGVESEYGIHYIQLVSIVKEDMPTFEEVKDKAIEAATEQNVDGKLTEKLNAYKSEVKITEYRPRIRAVGSEYSDMYFTQQTN